MKTISLAVAAVMCCILGSASVAPVTAQTTNIFNLSVCNASGIKSVSVALASRADAGGQTIRVMGWYNVPDAGCMDLGTYYRDRVYAYAQAPTGQFWNGDATTQCVNPTSRFERIVGGNYDCLPNEVAVGFFEVVVPANMGLYILTLNP
jgi:hypothetical protein